MLVSGLALYGSYEAGRYVESEKWKPLVSYWKDKVPIETPEENAADTILRICKEQNVDWLMCIRVADYESRLDRYFKERMKDNSYDRGVFAINSKHCPEVSDECAFNVECSTLYFTKEVKEGRISKWLGAKALGYK